MQSKEVSEISKYGYIFRSCFDWAFCTNNSLIQVAHLNSKSTAGEKKKSSGLDLNTQNGCKATSITEERGGQVAQGVRGSDMYSKSLRT